MNKLTIGDVEARRGATVLLPIGMENLKPMSGFQFYLTLPEGVTATGASVTERSEGLITPMGNMVGNVYRLSSINTGFDAIETGEGAVLNVRLNIADTVEPGDYTITLGDIIMFAEDGEEIKPSPWTATLTVKAFTLGDVNDNGEINTGDAICIVNHVIGKAQGTFIIEAADVNGNNEVNTGDAICIVNYVIGKTNALRAPSRGERSDRAFSGFECEVAVPAGTAIRSLALSESLADGMTLFYNRTGQNTYAVSALSLSGSSFSMTDGELLRATLTGSGEVETRNLRYFDSQGNEIEMAGATTGIAVATVESAGGEDVYDLSGRKVNAGEMRNGIYVKNNKKIIVR